MALSRLGGVGYLLSAVTAILLALASSFLLTPFLLIALFIHPVSIILRFLGWRRIGRLIEHRYLRIQPFPFLAIGLAYFATVFSGLSGSELLIPHYVVASIWAAYSLLESGSYLTVARAGARTLYVSLLNIPGVALILYALISLEPGLILGEEALGEIFILRILTAGLAILAASAISVSYVLLRWGPLPSASEHRPAYAELETVISRRGAAPRAPQAIPRTPPRPPPIRREPIYGPAARPPAPPRGGIAIQVISRGEAMSCRRCGASSPLGSARCTTCGAPLYADTPGLKCPVCGAPLSLASKLTPTHRICGVCFSDLSLSVGG